MNTRPALCALLVAALTPLSAQAFCGFYVAKADSKLFNKASQVVLVRDGNRTVMTMANDYQGEPKDFAVVIPVPTVIKRDAVEVMDKVALDHLDAYSAPRLVEYFDEDARQLHQAKREVLRGQGEPRQTSGVGLHVSAAAAR
jgi:hypothetical protein